jgi:hypothetical protein
MNAFLSRILSSAVAVAFLAGCAASSSPVLPRTLQSTPSNFSLAARSAKASVSLRIRVPKRHRAPRDLRSHYISPATQGIAIAISGPNGFSSNIVAGLTPSSPGCTTSSSGVTCTLSLGALAACAVANCYAATLKAYDAVSCAGGACTIPAGAKELSAAQSVVFNVAVGTTNTVSATLGGIPQSISVTPLVAKYLRGDAHELRLYGPQAQSLVVVALDADNDPIVGPGAPTISVSSGTNRLTASNPVAAAPNVVTLQAKTAGTPPVVTPGMFGITVTATPQGSSGGSPVSATIPVAVAHSAVWIGEFQHITAYYDGNTTTPNVDITGSNTGLTGGVGGLAVDGHGAIYVTINGSNEILEFLPGSNYNATPTVISGSNTLLSASDNIAVDSNGTMYVSNNGSSAVTEYAATTNGNQAPSAVLIGSGTLLNAPTGIALDANATIYAVSSATNTISEFAAGSIGNDLTRSISGNATNLAGEGWLAVLPDGTLCALGSTGPAIQEFASGASGNVTPVRTITGAATKLFGVSGIAADAAGTLYVANNNYVTEYAAGASGNATPIAQISVSGNVTWTVSVIPAAVNP